MECFTKNSEEIDANSGEPTSCLNWILPCTKKDNEKKKEHKKFEDENTSKNTNADLEDSTNLLNENKNVKN